MDEKIVKKTGWLYLVVIEFFIMTNIIRVFLGTRGEMNIILDLFLGQGLVVLPVIVYCLIVKAPVRDTFSIRAVRLPTLLLTFLYTLLWYPLLGACNAFTMFFSDNVAMRLTQEFEGISPFLMWLVVGVAGPLFEEFTFRGAILSGLSKSGRIFVSIVLSALMFGVLHLNLNQMAYAIVMGIAFGMAVYATGSIWCSFVSHMTINSVSIIAMQAMKSLPGDVMSQSAGAMDDEAVRNQLMVMIPVLLVIGLVSAGLSILLLKAMAAIEGREEDFRQMFSFKGNGTEKINVFTFPAVLGLVLGAVFIAVRLVMRV